VTLLMGVSTSRVPSPRRQWGPYADEFAAIDDSEIAARHGGTGRSSPRPIASRPAIVDAITR
jgi:hypothetical protein